MANKASPSLRSAAPVFVVEDVKRSVEHYRKALGFRVEFTHGDPASYAGIERDNVTVHLQTERDSKREAGQSAIYVARSLAGWVFFWSYYPFLCGKAFERAQVKRRR